VTVGSGSISNFAVTSDAKVYKAIYTPTADVEDATNVISVSIDWTDVAGNAPAAATNSANYAVDTNVNDLPNGAVTISGTATEDETLTAVTSTISDDDGIPSLYGVMDLGVGTTLGQYVTYKSPTSLSNQGLDGWFNVEINHPDYGWIPFSASPADTELHGRLIAANLDDILDNHPINYQWFANDVAIKNATESKLTLSQAEVSKAITVKVSYTDGYGASEELTSSASDTVANVNDLPTGSVTVSGTATEDATITVATSTVSDEDGLGDFSYQWLRDGTDISGATASTYTLAQADVGAAISIRASYTDGGGTAESVTSAATQTIISSAPSIAPFDIVLVSETGGVATFEIYADASVDPENDGFGSFEFKMSHDPTDMLIDVSTVSPPQGFIGVPAYNSNTGVLELAGITIPNFTDLSAPIAIFNATILDTDNPIDITISDGRVDNVLQGNVSETFDFTVIGDTTAPIITFDGSYIV
jgi:hypothetical protein